MTEYKISSPNAELLGGMLYSLWTAFPEGFQEIIKKVLAKHGVVDVVPENWYRLQPVLFSLNPTLHKFHRGGNIGGYEVKEEKTSQGLTRYHVIASTPYPC